MADDKKDDKKKDAPAARKTSKAEAVFGNLPAIIKAVTSLIIVILAFSHISKCSSQPPPPPRNNSATPWVAPTPGNHWTEEKQKELVLNSLSNAYDIPRADLDIIVARSGGGVGENFRVELYKQYTIPTTDEMNYVPRYPVDVPLNQKVYIPVTLKKGQWSRKISLVNWGQSTQAPLGMPNRVEGIYDQGTANEKRVLDMPDGTTHFISPSGEVLGVVPNGFSDYSSVILTLPSDYPLPPGMTEVTFTLVRTRS